MSSTGATTHAMDAAVSVTQAALASLRTGRAAPELLDRIRIDAYGSSMPLPQVAQVGVQLPRTLVVTPHDPHLLAVIERAILASDLGVSPSSDGQRIRIVLPEPSQERREQLARVARGEAEQGRVAIRTVRRDAINALRRGNKAGSVSDAQLNGRSKRIQQLTDEHVAQVDALLVRALDDIVGG